jgi:hypothetical protein
MTTITPKIKIIKLWLPGGHYDDYRILMKNPLRCKEC